MKKGLHRIRPKAYDGIINAEDDLDGKLLNKDQQGGLEKEKDAFEQLEQVKMDKEVGLKAKPTLQKMLDSREERHDDFSLNQKMRAKFRAKKQESKREEGMKAAEFAKFGMRVIPSSQLSDSDRKLKCKVI